jgi:hypothetical protein
MAGFAFEESSWLVWTVAITVAVAALALGITGLVWRHLWRRPWMPALGALLLAGLGALAFLECLSFFEINLEHMLGFVTCGAFLLGGLTWWQPVRRLFATRPACLSALMVIAGAGLGSGLYWPITAMRPGRLELFELKDPAHPNYRLFAQTDQGTPVPLCVYQLAEGTPACLERELKRQQADTAARAIQLAPPDMQYNCHGWLFTGGCYAIHQKSLQTILTENGYQEVREPRDGDLIIYFDVATDEIVHSGVVRAATAGGIVLIESKWGAGGRYLHPPEVQPYSNTYLFLRSPRKGHTLAGLAGHETATPIADSPTSGLKKALSGRDP